jgi:hypothetical protein
VKYPAQPLTFQVKEEPTDAVEAYLDFLRVMGFYNGENATNSITYTRFLDDFFVIG